MQKLGLIAGTGFADWLAGGKQHIVSTPYGNPSAAITATEINDYIVYYLPRHGNPHQLAPHAVNYRANVHALHLLGIKQIIAINVVGSIRTEWPSGSLIVPDQIIDYTWGREHTFFDVIDRAEQPIEHVDFTCPYTKPLRQALLRAGEVAGLNLFDGGCYAATQGPRLESAAEVQRIKRDGGDMIGMTGMPETSLAREKSMEFASVCLVSNLAAGIAGNELSIEEIMANVESGTQQVQDLLLRFTEQ